MFTVKYVGEPSVCLLLDTLRKIPNLVHFQTIPNLDSKATYCQIEKSEPTTNSNLPDFNIVAPNFCVYDGCEVPVKWNAFFVNPLTNGTPNWKVILYNENNEPVDSTNSNTIQKTVANNTAYYPVFSVSYAEQSLNKKGALIQFRDCEPPTIVVNDEVQATLGTVGTAVIYTTDLIESYADNCTNATSLSANLRVWHNSLGVAPTNIEGIKILPTTLNFDCSHLGKQIIKCYGFDDNDRWAESSSNLILVDGGNSCDNSIVEKESGFIATPQKRDVLSRIQKFIVLPSGELAAVTTNGYITIFNLGNNNQIRNLRAIKQKTSNIAVSPDGKLLLSGDIDKTTAYLWDIETGQKKLTLQGHSTPVFDAVTFSPDGRFVVTGSLDNTIKIWEVKTGRLVRTLAGHTSGVYGLDFSPDGQFLASSSSDGTAKIWRVSNGTLLSTLIHDGEVLSINYSPDGNYLLTNSNTSIKVWNNKGQLRFNIEESTEFFTAKFSLDGEFILITSQNAPAELIDIEDNLFYNFSEKTANIKDANFTLDGKQVIFCDSNDSFWKENFSSIYDIDEDGIIHSLDYCPTIFGQKSNNGCPILSIKEKEDLKWLNGIWEAKNVYQMNNQ